jgi:hypothetical protein
MRFSYAVVRILEDLLSPDRLRVLDLHLIAVGQSDGQLGGNVNKSIGQDKEYVAQPGHPT